jgi:hypothetical protein
VTLRRGTEVYPRHAKNPRPAADAVYAGILANCPERFGYPRGNSCLNACQALPINVAKNPLKHVFGNNCKTSRPDQAGLFQPCLEKIWFRSMHDFIDSGNCMANLKRYHANQPIFVRAGAPAEDERWTQGSVSLVGMGEWKQDNMSFRDNLKNSLISSAEYSAGSSSIPRMAAYTEKLDHPSLSDSFPYSFFRVSRNSAKCRTSR